MKWLWPQVGDAELDEAYEFSGGIRVNMVTSLDGAATVDGRSRPLTNKTDQELMQVLRRNADVVMVGAATIRQEGYGPLPQLAIVSGSLDLPSRPLTPGTIVLTHGDPPKLPGMDVIVCGESEVDFEVAKQELEKRGLRRILCEGGPHILGQLVAADLIDELCLSVSPVLAGPGAGRIVAGEQVSAARRMRLMHVLTDGELLFLRYQRP